MGNCIPTDQHALGRYDMELLRAGIPIEPASMEMHSVNS